MARKKKRSWFQSLFTMGKSHRQIGNKTCTTCGKRHSKSAHRAHGKGSFRRTHPGRFRKRRKK
jgi:hypothetical protein